MPRPYVPPEIYDEDAYARGRKARIMANANTTRRRKLEAAIANDSPEFKAWLLGGWRNVPALTPFYEAVDALAREKDSCEVRYEYYDHPAVIALEKAEKEWERRVGHLPEPLQKALLSWGGLSDKQLAWARRAFLDNIARAEKRDAEREAERATATPWEPGRQMVKGTVLYVRDTENDFGWTRKALVKRDDGSKLWVTLRSAEKGCRVKLSVNVQPKDDDPTFAFGSRPTKIEYLEPQDTQATPSSTEDTTDAEADHGL